MAQHPAITGTSSLKPLDFAAFLEAIGEDNLAAGLRDSSIETLVGEQARYEEALGLYCFVGGIPAAVRLYRATGSLARVHALHQELLAEIERAILGEARASLAGHALQVWHSTILQLREENKKFFYNAAGRGGRSRTHDAAIEWLVDSGLIRRVRRIERPVSPLAEQSQDKSFKLYLFDVGLLRAALQLGEDELEAGTLLAQVNGALAENFVCQELAASGFDELYYWSAPTTAGKVDFVVERGKAVVPISVQGSIRRRNKSLAFFIGKFGLAGGVRLSPRSFADLGSVAEMPLFAASLLGA